MSDSIDRQAAIDALRGYLVGKRCPDDGTLTCRLIENEVINKLPPIQPEIVHCKDCRKHNKKLGFDENYNITYKDDACPLIPWRGMSKGHEHDYQFCCFGEGREDE